MQIIIPEIKEGAFIINDDNKQSFSMFVTLYHNEITIDQNEFISTENIQTLMNDYSMFVANMKFKKYIEITIKNFTIDFIKKNQDETLYLESMDEYGCLSANNTASYVSYRFDEWKSFLSQNELDFLNLFSNGSEFLKMRKVWLFFRKFVVISNIGGTSEPCFIRQRQ